MNRDLCELAVRIAVQQVWRKAPRSIAAFLGIAGGIVLVLVQLGFQSALYDSAVRLHRVFKGELVIAPAAFSTVTSAQWFSRDRLLTTLAHPDVASAAPLYLSHIPLRNIDNGSREVILAIGIELDAPAIDLTTIQADVHNLRADGHVLFDIKSQPFFGPIPAKLHRNGHMEVDVPIVSELLHQTVTVVGTHALGGALTIAGTLLANSQTLANTTRQSLDRVNVGAIELKRGADGARVARELSAMLPSDVRVYTKQQFIDLERSYWSTETPIGFLFDLSAIIGFVIASVYISQVLFQIVDENLPQYALLKSMGYPPSFFVGLVMMTAAILAVAAIPVAVAAAEVVYHMCVRATLLDMKLTLARVSAVSAIIILIAMVAALAASRRLNRADPATLL